METSCDVGVPDHHDVYLRNCPCRGVLDMIANKWTALAIGALEEGPRRFGELRRRLEGISQKMLTQTLRDLERDGLITRTVYPVVPLRVDYALTDLGRSVADPLAAIRHWSEENIARVQQARARYEARETPAPVTPLTPTTPRVPRSHIPKCSFVQIPVCTKEQLAMSERGTRCV